MDMRHNCIHVGEGNYAKSGVDEKNNEETKENLEELRE